MRKQGIGIKNVLGRLNLYFGEKYDFTLTAVSENTEIILTLKLTSLKGVMMYRIIIVDDENKLDCLP